MNSNRTKARSGLRDRWRWRIPLALVAMNIRSRSWKRRRCCGVRVRGGVANVQHTRWTCCGIAAHRQFAGLGVRDIAVLHDLGEVTPHHCKRFLDLIERRVVPKHGHDVCIHAFQVSLALTQHVWLLDKTRNLGRQGRGKGWLSRCSAGTTSAQPAHLPWSASNRSRMPCSRVPKLAAAAPTHAVSPLHPRFTSHPATGDAHVPQVAQTHCRPHSNVCEVDREPRPRCVEEWGPSVGCEKRQTQDVGRHRCSGGLA